MGQGGPSSKPLFESALVVEPVSNLNHIVAKLLRGADVEQVNGCVTPVEAVPMIAQNRCDLVLCGSDLGAGQALASALRWGTDSPNREIAFILMEKQASVSSIKGAREIGIDSVLAVPFSSNMLVQRIKALAHARPLMIDAKNYVGPDRRTGDHPIPFPSRRTTVTPETASFEKTCPEILRDHILSRRRNPSVDEGVAPDNSSEQPGAPESSMQPTGPNDSLHTLAKLQEGMALARPCITKTGLTIVPAHRPLTARTIMQLKDMVAAQELTDAFFVAT